MAARSAKRLGKPKHPCADAPPAAVRPYGGLPQLHPAVMRRLHQQRPHQGPCAERADVRVLFLGRQVLLVQVQSQRTPQNILPQLQFCLVCRAPPRDFTIIKL